MLKNCEEKDIIIKTSETAFFVELRERIVAEVIYFDHCIVTIIMLRVILITLLQTLIY